MGLTNDAGARVKTLSVDLRGATFKLLSKGSDDLWAGNMTFHKLIRLVGEKIVNSNIYVIFRYLCHICRVLSRDIYLHKIDGLQPKYSWHQS